MALGEKAWEKIVLDNALNKKFTETAAALGITEYAVRSSLNMIQAVRDEDWEAVKKCIQANQSQSCMKWAANTYGVRIPEWVMGEAAKASEKRSENRKKPDVAVPTQTAENENLYFIKILEALNKQNDLLEQLMDVVIPKYAVDLKENRNANADVLNKTLIEIRNNTRRRGA